MSIWDEHDLERKITDILSEIRPDDPAHHFGRPFLTAYQLAIEFARRFPQDVPAGHQVGGRGVGQRYSLAQYLARELSRNMRDGRIRNIEGGFFSNLHLANVVFDNGGTDLESSLTDTPYDLSMFRLREP